MDPPLQPVACNFKPFPPSPFYPLQIKECKRLLRPGGTLALADNNPRSKVIQNLPPVLFTLMKRCARALRVAVRVLALLLVV
jgi:hypothetical protein